MQIFKAFFKVTKKSANWLLIYTGVFIVLCVLISALTENPDAGAYQDKKLTVVVFDDDNTASSRALYDFIGTRHTIEKLDTRDDEIIQDKLYYQSIQYVLTINKGYEAGLSSGKTEDILTYTVDPKSYYAEYLNLQLRQYVSTASLYFRSGLSAEDACAATADNLKNETEVNIPTFGETEKTTLDEKFYTFNLYIAYVIPVIMICVLSRIILAFNSKDIAARISCAPVSAVKKNLSLIGASIVFCVALWALMSIIAAALSGFPSIGGKELLIFLNSFIFTLVSAAIAIFASELCRSNADVIDIIGIVLALGMAFLGGVFVSQSLLSDAVLTVGKILPTYWYVKATNVIGEVGGEIMDYGEVWTCFGIELLFALALFAGSIAVTKLKKNK